MGGADGADVGTTLGNDEGVTIEEIMSIQKSKNKRVYHSDLSMVRR